MWEGSTSVVLHCGLAKFCGLMMYKGKYCDVIGRETRCFVCAQQQFPCYGFSGANHSAVFTLVHQTSTFRRTTVVVNPKPFSCRVLNLGGRIKGVEISV
jgi:hypothetical protein